MNAIRTKSWLVLFSLLFLLSSSRVQAASDMFRTATQGLIRRVLPAQASAFIVEKIPADPQGDVFELESRGNKIVLRGNTPVAAASGLNWYLKYYCHCQLSWGGDNLNLPETLPAVSEKVRKVTPFKERVYLNYCTFSYTMAWWDWDRWQREIDWMALHGINMPLAITGQEAVWEATLRHYKMSDQEIRHFLCGPAFFAWQWMTNIEGYAGPLPQHWIDTHIILEQRILKRERELGMTPILQGFTGYVPSALIAKYPQARIKQKPVWCGIGPGPAQVDPLDPLFAQMGKTFLQEQARLFGTDHLYAADPFHEGSPPVPGAEYLRAVGKTVYDVTASVDPQARIVMQTWSVRQAIVEGIPQDKILLFDLTGNKWQACQGYWGREWVAGILQNYGGRIFLGGDLKYYADNAFAIRSNPAAGHITGIGLFPEGIEQNPIIYELATEIAWRDKAPDLDQWVRDYAHARYGKELPDAEAAWKILQNTVYTLPGESTSFESPFCARPALHITQAAPNGGLSRTYKSRDLWPALDDLLRVREQVGSVSTYRYDVTDLTRQVLSDLAIPLQQKIEADYRAGDATALATDSAQYMDLLKDTDTMLASRQEFLLGKWIGDARKWGQTNEEKALYERNARTQITVWGPPGVKNAWELFDYSNRQWAGLMDGFYKVRWEKFLAYLQQQPAGEGRFTDKGLRLTLERPADDANDFYKGLSTWEFTWCDQTDNYPATPAGDSIAIATRLYQKWQPVADIVLPQ